MANANAWPATGGASLPIKPDAAVKGVSDIASQIAQLCANYQTAVASGSVPANQIVNMYSNFFAWNALLAQYAAVPNVVAFAQTQLGASFDVSGSFSALQNALTAAENWIGSNFPTSGAVNVGAQGTVVWASFSAASLSQLTALITTLQATVN